MLGFARVGMLVLVTLALGCDAVQSITGTPEDRMVALKVERTEILDTLYSEYGGGDIANATTAAVKEVEGQDGSNPLVDMVVGAVSEGDRELFDANCELMGAGERSTAFTTKARDFFAQDSVKKRCLKVGKLLRQIQTLQAEISSSGT